MSVFFELQRPRQVGRIFKSPEALIAEVIAPAKPGLGHLDQRQRALER